MKKINGLLLIGILSWSHTSSPIGASDAPEELVSAQQVDPYATESKEEIRIKRSYTVEEGDEPDETRLSQIQLKSEKMAFYIGGRLKDEAFIYNRVNTLRKDISDQNDFIRHRMNIDFLFDQRARSLQKKPTSQAFIRLTNYLFWQKDSNYMPLAIDEITSPDLPNITLAKNVRVKNFLPLLFVEQAWFKLNFDTFTDLCKNNPTMLKVGYFPYIVGRGVTMGFHDDLAVDYLGWAGDGGFTRYPVMPPGVLFHTQLNRNFAWDVYFNLWRETNASLSDTLLPARADRLNDGPSRGTGKDRVTWATRFDYVNSDECFGDILAQPYFVYVDAPEQGIEFSADASSKLFTTGMMVDWSSKGWHVNVEAAGQFGRQHVHAIDRNVQQLGINRSDGTVAAQLSHVFLDTPGSPVITNGGVNVAAREIDTLTIPPANFDVFEPQNLTDLIVDTPTNRNLSRQGLAVLKADGKAATLPGPLNIVNSTEFGNARFRNPYRLGYNGFMALADVSYDFECQPLKVAGAAGYISGDQYPYNEERSRSYDGFIPLRSRYRGLDVQNFLIFDRLVIPRPLNISNRTLYAFNNIKDLSNLAFLGAGLTWFPLAERRRMAVTTDIMFLWEAASLHKWDKNGTHPDPTIEIQLKRLRNQTQSPGPIDPSTGQPNYNNNPTLFKGWQSAQKASQMLGTEIDIKMIYRIIDHCDFLIRFSLFFPGQLYKDLDGQPNILLQRYDKQGILHYESLGSSAALAGVFGLNYRF